MDIGRSYVFITVPSPSILYSIHIGVICQVTQVSLVTREILSLSVSLVTPVNLVNQVSTESILWTQFVWSQ